MHPLISVIIPIYNGERYLPQAIKSIINQTYKKLEIILINDGSSDGTLKIIRKFINQDRRIRLINRENKGLIFSLNEGINASNGDFIARMDSDDISDKHRIETQLNYIYKYNLDIVGSAVEYIGDKCGYRAYPSKDEEIKMALTIGCPLAHPTVIGRAAIFKQHNYSQFAKNYEDYELWCRMAKNGVRFGNVVSPLLKYRIHESQVSTKNRLDQIDGSLATMFRYAAHYFNDATLCELSNKSINSGNTYLFIRFIMTKLKLYRSKKLEIETNLFLYSFIPYLNIPKLKYISIIYYIIKSCEYSTKILLVLNRVIVGRKSYAILVMRLKKVFNNL